MVIGCARLNHWGLSGKRVWHSTGGQGWLCSEVRPSGDACWGLSEEAQPCCLLPALSPLCLVRCGCCW